MWSRGSYCGAGYVELETGGSGSAADVSPGAQQPGSASRPTLDDGCDTTHGFHGRGSSRETAPCVSLRPRPLVRRLRRTMTAPDTEVRSLAAQLRFPLALYGGNRPARRSRQIFTRFRLNSRSVAPFARQRCASNNDQGGGHVQSRNCRGHCFRPFCRVLQPTQHLACALFDVGVDGSSFRLPLSFDGSRSQPCPYVACLDRKQASSDGVPANCR